MKMDALAAANRIRPTFNDVSADLSPEDRHHAKFVSDVCRHLGVDSTPENNAKVSRALEQNGIEPHIAHEWPKYVEHPTLKDDKNRPVRVVVHNQEEHDRLSEDRAEPDPNQDHTTGLAPSQYADDFTHHAPTSGELAGRTDVPTQGTIPTDPNDIDPTPYNPQIRNVRPAKLTADTEPNFSATVVGNAENRAAVESKQEAEDIVERTSAERDASFPNAGAGRLGPSIPTGGKPNRPPAAPQRRAT